MNKKQPNDLDPEIIAMGVVHKAVKDLSPDAQGRVLSFVAEKLKIVTQVREPSYSQYAERSEPVEPSVGVDRQQAEPARTEDGLEGISPVAKKWMIRNDLDAKALSTVFSLGGDEIDLIAKSVPGNSVRERMHNVLLLKGVAAYLGSGVGRFTHQQLKEASLHYKAYDAPNFAAAIKGFAADASGEKNSGYTLTPRGLAAATDLVKRILKKD